MRQKREERAIEHAAKQAESYYTCSRRNDANRAISVKLKTEPRAKADFRALRSTRRDARGKKNALRETVCPEVSACCYRCLPYCCYAITACSRSNIRKIPCTDLDTDTAHSFQEQ